MIYTVRPISDRTAFVGESVNSPFTVAWSTCLEVLERELDFLDATDTVFEVDVPERGIRLDGQLRNDAKAASPAVRIAFGSSVGPLVYATDMFARPSWRRNGMQQDWQHNVYAIALGLEALRKVDRYGIARRHEQYTGYRAIGSGNSMPAAASMTVEQAEGLLGCYDDGRGLAYAHRRARAAVHPDRHQGNRTAWDQVEQAAAVLGLLE